MKKEDLVEIYKRIALPMPQRRSNEGKHLGKKLNDLRISKNIAIAENEEYTLYD
jgi:hypothetical protein